MKKIENNKYFHISMGSILAAFAVCIASYVYIVTQIKNTDFKVLGGLAFCVGFFLICGYSWHLFTGKIGYVFSERKASYLIDLAIILVINFIVCVLLGLLISQLTFTTKGSDGLSVLDIRNNLNGILDKKVEQGWTTIISGFFCGLLIHITAIGWKSFPNFGLKAIVLIFAIGTFVLSGFDHVLANTFYISLAGRILEPKLLLVILYSLIGNSLGAIFINTCHNLFIKSKVQPVVETENKIN